MAGSIGESIQDAARLLAKAGIESPQREARVLLAHLIGCSGASLIAHPETPVDESARSAFAFIIDERARRKPLAYILGEWEFYGLCLEVTPDVLVPRPETEVLVEAVTTRLTGRSSSIHIADIGTGSGAIAVALAQCLPSARIVATDTSKKALEVAKANSENYNLEGKIRFEEGDLIKPLRLMEQFDAIVSNPPYVRRPDLVAPQPELLWEPLQALDGGEDGLDVYRRLVPDALTLLRDDGFLAVEVGMGQAVEVSKLASEAGYAGSAIIPDLAGIERVVVAWR